MSGVAVAKRLHAAVPSTDRSTTTERPGERDRGLLKGRYFLTLGIAAESRILVAAGATDMRMGFNGLQGVVTSVLEQDPLSGHLFPFINQRSDKLKILFWDGDGLAIWHRRLEQGTIQVPARTMATKKEISGHKKLKRPLARG